MISSIKSSLKYCTIIIMTNYTPKLSISIIKITKRSKIFCSKY